MSQSTSTSSIASCLNCQTKFFNKSDKDSDSTPYDQYLKMLSDERIQFDKIIKITQNSDGQEDDQKIITPSKYHQVQRQSIVQDYIINLGKKLRRSNLTIHLAVKFYDFISITQIEEAFSQSGKNQPQNLKLLAAQCLLLSSKYNDIRRIYPAELIYSVKKWGATEYEILKSGQIEEYILNIFEFDLVFLTPADFIAFFTETWESVKPDSKCKNGSKNGEINNFISTFKSVSKKIKMYASEFSSLFVQHLGHSISIKYLPSQIAAASLFYAQKTVLQFEKERSTAKLASDTIDQVAQYIDETMKIIGYSQTQEMNGFAKVIQQIKSNSSLAQILDGRVKILKQPILGNNSPLTKNKIENKENKAPKLAKISSDNQKKFDKLLKKKFDLDKGKELYPCFVPSNIEVNINVTISFFGEKYENKVNKKASEICSPDLLPQVESLNIKQLHTNSHENQIPKYQVPLFKQIVKEKRVFEHFDQENLRPTDSGEGPIEKMRLRLENFFPAPRLSDDFEPLKDVSSRLLNNGYDFKIQTQDIVIQDEDEQDYVSAHNYTKADLDKQWAALYEDMHRETSPQVLKPQQQRVFATEIEPLRENKILINQTNLQENAQPLQNVDQNASDLTFNGTEKKVSDLVKNYRPLRQPKKKDGDQNKKKGFLAQAAENLFAHRHMPPAERETHLQNPKLI